MRNVSACVIVKNEEQNLPKWLESMKGLADELVVVDTGSEDRTAAIAKAAGAHVYDFPWRNDFAAAKNYAMDHAHGKWLLLLDADEYIRPEDYPAVKHAIQTYTPRWDVIGFVCRLVNIDRDDHGRFQNDGVQIRLVRNLPELRYHGTVHEFLRYEGKGKKRMEYLAGVTIWHTGYSSGVARQKLQRNLKILLAQREEKGETLFNDGYLADCYYGLEDYEKAAAYADHAIHGSGLLAVGRETRAYSVWLQSLIKLERPEEEIDAALREASEAYPLAADFFALAGFGAWRRGDYQKAAKRIEESLARYQKFLAARRAGETELGDEMQSLLPLALGYLAKIAFWRGRRDDAEAYLSEALQRNRYQAWCTMLLSQFHEKDDDAAFIATLQRYYQPKADAPYLLKHLPAQRGRVRLYYAKQGGIPLPIGEKYLLAGKLEEAAAALAEDMQTHLARGLHAVAQGAPLAPLAPFLPAQWRRAIAGEPGEAEEKIRTRLQARQASASC